MFTSDLDDGTECVLSKFSYAPGLSTMVDMLEKRAALLMNQRNRLMGIPWSSASANARFSLSSPGHLRTDVGPMEQDQWWSLTCREGCMQMAYSRRAAKRASIQLGKR